MRDTQKHSAIEKASFGSSSFQASAKAGIDSSESRREHIPYATVKADRRDSIDRFEPCESVRGAKRKPEQIDEDKLDPYFAATAADYARARPCQR